MIVKLLTEHYLEFLSLKGGCRGSSESTLVKMSNCWKSHALAHNSLLSVVRPTDNFNSSKPGVLIRYKMLDKIKCQYKDVKLVFSLLACNKLINYKL